MQVHAGGRHESLQVRLFRPSHAGVYLHAERGGCLPAAHLRPAADRIDLHVEALPVEYDDLASEQGGESSADVRARVMAARALQRERYKALPGVRCNAQLPSGALRRYCRMTPAAEKILRSAFERLGYSARAYDRILRVARPWPISTAARYWTRRICPRRCNTGRWTENSGCSKVHTSSHSFIPVKNGA